MDPDDVGALRAAAGDLDTAIDEEPVPSPEPARPRSNGLATARRAVVATLPIYVVSRLVVLAAAKATTWLYPQLTVTQGLAGWDGAWYIAIARDGYPPSLQNEGAGVRWAFSPGFPGAIRAVSDVTGLSLSMSGIVLSTVAGAAAVAVIWVLVADVLGEATATSTAALMSFFPMAFVFSMVYTEGLFILLVAVGLLATVRRRWLTAGLMASLACLIRPPGLALVAVLGVVALRELLARRFSVRMLLGVLISVTGFAGWSIYQWVRLGDPAAYLEAQRIGWYNEFSWFSTPFRSLWRVLTDRAAWSRGDEVLGALALVIVAASAVLAALYVRRHRRTIPLEWWVFIVASTAYAFSPYWPTSILRYTFALFPLYAIALAQLPRRAITPVLCASAGTMAVLTVIAIGGLADWQHAPFAP
jgi:hypothetical protein